MEASEQIEKQVTRWKDELQDIFNGGPLNEQALRMALVIASMERWLTGQSRVRLLPPPVSGYVA